MKAFLFIILSFWLETIHVVHPYGADFQPIFFFFKQRDKLILIQEMHFPYKSSLIIH